MGCQECFMLALMDLCYEGFMSGGLKSTALNQFRVITIASKQKQCKKMF